MVLRPVLFRTESFAIGSYPFMIILAGALALVTIELRAGRRRIDRARLLRTVLISLLGGWAGGRVLPVLLHLGPGRLRWSLLNPAAQAGLSLSMFLIVAAPLAAISLYSARRRALIYLDVIAPSLLLGLAVVKIGCLLAGCCAGRACESPWAITYPYGSVPFVSQWQDRMLTLPAELMRRRADGSVVPLGHVQMFRAVGDDPPERLIAHAEAHGLSWPELVAAVETSRSTPVWPVPLWYIVAAGVLWLVAEGVYRRVTWPGMTIGFVLCGYGLMRVVFDGFVAGMKPGVLPLGITQLLAVVAALLGVVLIRLALRRGARADILTTDKAPAASRRKGYA